MLALAEVFAQPDLAYLAPEAAGRSWYPYSFLAPIVRNEPFLSSALAMLDRLLALLGSEAFEPERVVLLGFSQGACLALEYAARHARRYGGVVGLSGGLIGPEGTPRDYGGQFAGTPVFLGCSDTDPHIPLDRVHETAGVIGTLGGAVTERIYAGMGHGINEDEIKQVRGLLATFATPRAGDDQIRGPASYPRRASIESKQLAGSLPRGGWSAGWEKAVLRRQLGNQFASERSGRLNGYMDHALAPLRIRRSAEEC